jgi:hypothetical protein
MMLQRAHCVARLARVRSKEDPPQLGQLFMEPNIETARPAPGEEGQRDGGRGCERE